MGEAEFFGQYVRHRNFSEVALRAVCLSKDSSVCWRLPLFLGEMYQERGMVPMGYRLRKCMKTLPIDGD